MVGISDDLLDDPVPALVIGVDEPDRGGAVVDVFEGAFQIALLFVDERFPIREQELHIPGLRPVDGGIVDFVEDAVRDGKPDAARGGVRHAYAVFST